MRSISAQESVEKFVAFVQIREDLTQEEKDELVSALEKSLDECDRRYYETKASIDKAREHHNQAVGPISRFIFKLLRI